MRLSGVEGQCLTFYNEHAITRWQAWSESHAHFYRHDKVHVYTEDTGCGLIAFNEPEEARI